MSFEAPRGAVISIGNFDGVHLGHRALLGRMRELAEAAGAPAVVITFFPPAKVFFTGADFLSTAQEKRMLLEEFRPDRVVMVPFDDEFRETTKEQFLADLGQLEPRAFVVGGDFRFGRGRAGSVEDLARLAPVEPFELVSVDGRPVGSSRVRELLAEGRVEEANRLLGAPYMAHGTVVRGAQRGRTIGYPTANLELSPRKALPTGVFAVTVEVPVQVPTGPSSGAGADLPSAAAGGSAGRERTHLHGGMASVGERPMFPDGSPSLEAHIFDFDRDIYDEVVTVRFVRKLRDQVRFGSLEELKAQLAADEAAAREALGRG